MLHLPLGKAFQSKKGMLIIHLIVGYSFPRPIGYWRIIMYTIDIGWYRYIYIYSTPFSPSLWGGRICVDFHLLSRWGMAWETHQSLDEFHHPISLLSILCCWEKVSHRGGQSLGVGPFSRLPATSHEKVYVTQSFPHLDATFVSTYHTR